MVKKRKNKQKSRLRRKKKSLSPEKQLKISLIIMGVLIVSVFFFFWLSTELRKFEYVDLEFSKVKVGDLVLYKSEFPARDKITGAVIGGVPFFLREDPRKLENISIGGKIKLKKDVAVAASQDLIGSYEDSVLAGSTLSLFLNTIGAEVSSGTINKTEAEETNRSYVSCKEGNYSVIVYQESKDNRSRIYKDDECYVLSFANGEIMDITERFMIGAYAHSNYIELK